MVGPCIFSPERQQLVNAQIELDDQHNNEHLFFGPLSVEVVFYSSLPRSKKSAADFLKSPTYHRTDLHNFIGFVRAVAPGIIYEPHSSIVSLYAKKLYAQRARTEISIIQLEEGEDEENY